MSVLPCDRIKIFKMGEISFFVLLGPSLGKNRSQAPAYDAYFFDQKKSNSTYLLLFSRPRDISIIELRYRSEEFIKTLRQKNGILVFLESLGSVSGSVLTIALVIFVISKLMSKRKEMLFKRR